MKAPKMVLGERQCQFCGVIANPDETCCDECGSDALRATDLVSARVRFVAHASQNVQAITISMRVEAGTFSTLTTIATVSVDGWEQAERFMPKAQRTPEQIQARFMAAAEQTLAVAGYRRLTDWTVDFTPEAAVSPAGMPLPEGIPILNG